MVARKVQLGFATTFQHLSLALIAATISACGNCLQPQSLIPIETPVVIAAGLYFCSWSVCAWRFRQQTRKLQMRLEPSQRNRYGLVSLVVHRAVRGFGHSIMVAGLIIRTGSYRVLLTYFIVEYMASWAGFHAWIWSRSRFPRRRSKVAEVMTDARVSVHDRPFRLLERWNGRSNLAVLLGEIVPLALVIYFTLNAGCIREGVAVASWKSELIALRLWRRDSIALVRWLLMLMETAHLMYIGANLLLATWCMTIIVPDQTHSSSSS